MRLAVAGWIGLVLLLAAVHFRAQFVSDCWAKQCDGGVVTVRIYKSGIGVYKSRTDSPSDISWAWQTAPATDTPGRWINIFVAESRPLGWVLGFQYDFIGWDSSRWVPTWRSGGIFVPYWPAVVMLALPAPFAVQRWRRIWRQRRGLCETCGYDLRACSECCSECGVAIA